MELIIKGWHYKKILLFVIDLIIMLSSIILFFILFFISYKEYHYRGSVKLYSSQFLLGFVIVSLDLFMNYKNLKFIYTGNNKYGMIIRFCMFYLLVPCVVLTLQKSENINHRDIKSGSNLILFFGIIIGVSIVLSIIFSFTIVDEQKSEKIKVEKNKKEYRNVSIENLNLLDEIYTDNRIVSLTSTKENENEN